MKGGAIWHDLSRAELDREYDNRAKVPDSAQQIAWYGRRSAETREALGGALDVRYGPHQAETLDIFGAGPPAGRPVNVFFHGGYWRAMHKDDFSFVANAFVPAGMLAVVVNYALVPSVDMDELVAQCRRAMAWLYRNIADYGGDPGRLFVSGHSAGGHLVAMLMATDWPAFDAGCPADLVAGGLGISGLYDLEPIRLCFLNESLGLDREATRRNSPLHLRRRVAGELVLVYGAEEGDEYAWQSDVLGRAWEKTRVEVMAGHDHFSIMRQLDDPGSALSRIALGMMTIA